MKSMKRMKKEKQAPDGVLICVGQFSSAVSQHSFPAQFNSWGREKEEEMVE